VIHLDTSFLIRALVPASSHDRRLREWIARGEPLGMSAIAWAEFLCGPVDEHQVKLAAQIVSERVPFGEEDAAVAARLFNESGRHRGSLVDCMIAAAALRAGAAVATANPSDFRRFEAGGINLVAG